MMETICDENKCTGCGMCTNICQKNAIQMVEGKHGFIYPSIDGDLCIDCGLCKKTCPANVKQINDSTVKGVYAAWANDKVIQKQSTSGGIFSILAKEILDVGGVVVGVAWNDKFHATHVICDNIDDLNKLRGSKYAQSDTGNLYVKVKSYLLDGKKVLFSGTPCQNAALHSYLGKDYENLLTVDLVCHGVPSSRLFDEYLQSFAKGIKNISLRYKDPYWDFTFVRIEFQDGSCYQKHTVDDPYFNLFNIGYSIRESCHGCKYTTLHRESDITLADFWGYRAHNFRTSKFLNGTSLVLVNSKKGQNIFEQVKKSIYYENADLNVALKRNKCLSEPFKVDERKLASFWADYDNGMLVKELDEKYTKGKYKIPSKLTLRRFMNQYGWIVRK